MTRSHDGRRARGEASRQAILSAATHIVAHDGIPALTHRIVAERAGVSHALVTYHFSGVVDLRRAVFSHAGHRLAVVLEDLLVELPDPQDVPQVVATLAVRMAGDLRQETLTCFAMMLDATRDAELRPAVQAFVHQVAALVEAQSRGQERAQVAAAAVLGYLLTAMALGEDSDPAALRDGVISLVEHFDPARPQVAD